MQGWGTTGTRQLEIGISSERQRNHPDLHSRLDSKAQREGEVFYYRVSELRVVQLLDGLCDKMQDCALKKLESGEKGWVKVMDWNSFQTGMEVFGLPLKGNEIV